MKKKNNIIQNLYDRIVEEIHNKKSKGYDILLDENVDDEKIEWFIGNFSKNIINETFTEGEVDVVYYDQIVKTGFQDKFEFTSENKIKFYTTVTYHKTPFIIDQIENQKFNNLYKNIKSDDCLDEYLIFLKNNINKYVVYFEFEDFNKVKEISNKVGNYTYHVFGGVVRSIRQSLSHNKNLAKVNSVYFAIHKQEIKRLSIYDKIVSSEMYRWKNKCIDHQSDNKNLLIYYW